VGNVGTEKIKILIAGIKNSKMSPKIVSPPPISQGIPIEMSVPFGSTTQAMEVGVGGSPTTVAAVAASQVLSALLIPASLPNSEPDGERGVGVGEGGSGSGVGIGGEKIELGGFLGMTSSVGTTPGMDLDGEDARLLLNWGGMGMNLTDLDLVGWGAGASSSVNGGGGESGNVNGSSGVGVMKEELGVKDLKSSKRMSEGGASAVDGEGRDRKRRRLGDGDSKEMESRISLTEVEIQKDENGITVGLNVKTLRDVLVSDVEDEEVIPEDGKVGLLEFFEEGDNRTGKKGWKEGDVGLLLVVNSSDDSSISKFSHLKSWKISTSSLHLSSAFLSIQGTVSTNGKRDGRLHTHRDWTAKRISSKRYNGALVGGTVHDGDLFGIKIEYKPEEERWKQRATRICL
jgi:hypothetical protein